MTTHKIVSKPWGSEEWLELNTGYCFKKISINAGCRTSLHYHKRKTETNVVISGIGVMRITGTDGTQLDAVPLDPGSVLTFYPGEAHRLEAATSMVLLEASTPEVDDVIRIADDAQRGDGRIESEHD